MVKKDDLIIYCYVFVFNSVIHSGSDILLLVTDI